MAQVKTNFVKTDYIAEIVGVTKRRIKQFQEEGIIQAAGKGLYDRDVVFASLFAWYREKSGKPEKPSDALEAERLRQTAARATLEEIKVKRAKSDLHHTDDIIRVFCAIFSRIHAGLESFPLGIAPLLTDNHDAMDIATKLKERLDKILYEMTTFDFDTFKSSGGADFMDALETAGEAEGSEPD